MSKTGLHHWKVPNIIKILKMETKLGNTLLYPPTIMPLVSIAECNFRNVEKYVSQIFETEMQLNISWYQKSLYLIAS